MMKVPLGKIVVDDELKARIMRVLDSGTYILGPECRAFEAELAQWSGRAHAVLVANATSAATLTLLALGIGPGDEVIVPAHTAFPTVEAVFDAGATPVFADIERKSFTMDPAHVERLLGPRTKAIVPVHLYGHPCDLDPIVTAADRRGIPVIEDCAQAHGARYRDKLAGTFGRAATLSFYPSKNLPVLGDGGAVITDDAALAARLRMLRDHGRAEKHIHAIVGWNMRFNEIQAASGRHFLARLDDHNERRRAAAAHYRARLRAIPDLALPVERSCARAVYHLFVVRLKDRDSLARALAARGIESGVHYPTPMHLQPAVLVDRGLARCSLPETEAAAREVLSLPLFPTIQRPEIDHVCDAIIEHLGAPASGRA